MLLVNLGFNIFACYVLGDSFYRVYKATKANNDLEINKGMMLAHILSYALFIIAMFLFLLILGAEVHETVKFYAGTLDSVAVVSTGS